MLPILRKDFIVDPYQLYEALAGGRRRDPADRGRARPSASSLELHELAGALGLAALVEVHDRRELEVAAALGAGLIGINNRDLTTLQVDVATDLELLPGVPDGVTVVAESGLRTRSELDELARAGVDAVLIGEALMRAGDIEARLARGA